MPTPSHAARRLSRRLHAGTAILAVTLGVACTGRNGKPSTAQPDIPLVVHNSGYNDVIIYALLASSDARVRVGMVNGNSDARITVRRTLTRSDGVIVLNLRAIGSRYGWTTPSLNVQPGEVACLDIFSDPSGDLSRSSFYLVAMDDPSDAPSDSAAKAAQKRSLQHFSCRAPGGS